MNQHNGANERGPEELFAEAAARIQAGERALAIFTNVTAIQRIYEVYWRTNAIPGKQFVKPKDNSAVQG